VWLLCKPGAGCAALAAAGALAGLAYGTRPEGAALLLVAAPWLGRRRGAGAAAAFAAGFAALAWPWPLGWALWGGGLTPTPKLAFNYRVGVGAAGDDAWAHYAAHLAQLPGEFCEAIGYAAAPLALVGLLGARRWGCGSPAALVGALLALQAAVIPLLRSHHRFLSGYGCLALVFAGVAVARAAPRWRRLAPGWQVALACAALAGDLVRIPAARRADRAVLVELGGWLRPRLPRGERIATEMPRLEWLAGQRPSPPRRIERAELLAACAAPATRYAVVVAARSGVTAADLAAAGLRPLALPPARQAAAAPRGRLVYERPP
jgi:hypothetical protein